MPRRRRPESREILPDPLYGSTLAEKFVNNMMWDGKKAVSQKIFYEAMDKIRERSGDDPLKLFKKAVENCKPLVEVKTRRVRSELSGARRGTEQSPDEFGDPLDSDQRPFTSGKDHARKAGE